MCTLSSQGMGEIKIHTWRKLGMRVFSILILPGCIVSRKQLGDLRRANAHLTESNRFQPPPPVVRARNMRVLFRPFYQVLFDPRNKFISGNRTGSQIKKSRLLFVYVSINFMSVDY